MNIITYLKDIPIMKKVFGILIMIAGLYILLTTTIFFGLVFIVIGVYLQTKLDFI